MSENVCQQCREKISPPSNRLVQDACGHQKCRRCLLKDELGCQQCRILNGTLSKLDNNSVENSVPFENHTAVIQCNGTPKVTLDMVNSSYNNSGSIKEEPRPLKLENKMVDLDEIPIRESKSQSVAKVTNFGTKDFKSKNLKKETEYFNDFKTPSKNSSIKKESELHVKFVREKKKNDLPDHVSVNFEPLYFHCNLCNKKFKNRGHVKYHKFCTGEARPYKCTLCTKDFILKAQLELHLVKHRKEKPLSCNICDKSFYETTKLKRHLQVHSEEKTHLCTACGKTYRTKEALQVHFSIHKGEKLFCCRLCTAKFNNSSNLKRHLVSHSSKKLHMCDLCGKTFKLKCSLKVHRKSHNRIREFQCKTCSKTFVLNKELQRHMLTHDDSTTYNCSACHTSFRRKDNLYRHIKNTHPEKKNVNIIVEKQNKPSQTKEHSEKTTNKPTRPSSAKPTNVKNVVMDNPNAIKVITASPAFVTKSKNHLSNAAPPCDMSKRIKIVDSRDVVAGSQAYNGPPKLAFKGPAFKMHYNIKRGSDYVSSAQVPQPINLSESVDICQKIMSPSTDYTCPVSLTIDERTSTEIYQKILCVSDKHVPESEQIYDGRILLQENDCSYEFEDRIKTESETEPVDTHQISPNPTRNIDQREFPTSPTREISPEIRQVPLNLSESVDICQRIMSPSIGYRDPIKTVDQQHFKETCQKILSIPGCPPVVPINLSESVHICQRIMSPSTDYRDPTKTVNEQRFKETCQKILWIPRSPPLVPINPSESVDICQQITDNQDSVKTVEEQSFKETCQKILSIPRSPIPVPINLSESVDICQKIMSPSTDYRDPTKTVDEQNFKETCQKILSIPRSPPPVDICQRIMSPSTDYRDPTRTVNKQSFKETYQKIPPPVPINLSESVDICQRIMSPSTDYRDPTKTVDEQSFKETCQKILSISDQVSEKTMPLSISAVPSPSFSSYSSPLSDYSQYSSPSPRPGLPQYSNKLHYASSFQNQKHAVIKSIKFKVPQEYTKIFKQQQEKLGSKEDLNKNGSGSAETASVIVNNSSIAESR